MTMVEGSGSGEDDSLGSIQVFTESLPGQQTSGEGSVGLGQKRGGGWEPLRLPSLSSQMMLPDPWPQA